MTERKRSLARNSQLLRVTILITLLCALPALAGTFLAFGPETFVRGSGEPVAVVRTFSVLNPSAQYKIQIYNGGMQDGEYEKVSSTVILLNGVNVLGPDELKESVAYLEKPVQLQSSNTLSVEVRGQPGSALVLQIAGEDNDLPTITPTVAPAPNANGWHKSDVTITYACSDATSGIASCPTPVTVTTEGANQVISGTATDRAGNSATASVTLNIDKTAPTITAAASPQANASGWNNSDVTVTFTCADSLSGIATCPPPNTAATGDGANQVISGTAVDRAGNTASAGVTLNIDKTPPSVTTSASPAPNAAGWNNSDVTISFTCSDDGSGVVQCPGLQVVSAEGANQTISRTVADRAGNTASATATVKLDKTAPSVVITSPASGTNLNVSTVGLAGTLADSLSGLASASCNGASTPFTGGSFNCNVALSEGANTATVRAKDVADNEGTASVTVNYVRVPIVTITAPAPLSVFGSGYVNVIGAVDDPTATVTVNGVAAGSGGSFTATGVSLREGPNVITATATSAAGAVGTASVTVSLDTTPPRVTIDSPGNGFVTAESAITVTGMINDLVVGTVNPEQATVAVNGTPALVSNRSFVAADVPLAMGLNTITALGMDRAHNTAVASISVTRQALAEPRIAIVSGNNQTATIGTQVPDPLIVQLTDGAGTPVAGQTVIFRVMENNGTLAGGSGPVRALTAASDSQGRAQAAWTLGTRAGAGNNIVEATAVGFAGRATFTANALLAPAANIHLDAGNNQVGAVGQALPYPFVVVVTDAGFNRVANVPVTFTVKEGGGHFNGQPSLGVNTDSDGRALAVLALSVLEGIENNVVEATFPGNIGLPAVFVASGKPALDPANTRISGVVLDGSQVPVPGVTLRIAGTAISTQADAQGHFVIQPAPVGLVKLLADGSTAQRPGTWASLEFDLVTIAGQDNTVDRPIYLLPLDLPNGLFVDENTGGTLTLPDLPGFSLTVAPGSSTFPGGSRQGVVSVTVVHADRIPHTPNFGQQPRLIVTIQPAGVRFDPPAAVTYPNVDGMAPGQVTELYSFDHDIGQFVSIGTGTVSEDGAVLRSDSGVGIIKGGWHCGGNPPGSTARSGSLRVTLGPDPDPIKLAYGGRTPVEARGRPPQEGRYLDWKIKEGSKTFDEDISFLSQPSCPDQTECENTLEGPQLIITQIPEGERRIACGTAEAEVTFECTTTRQKVTDTARVEVGCEVKSASQCTSFCDTERARGMCGTPCELVGATPRDFDPDTGNSCWSVSVGSNRYCYWDSNDDNGQDYRNLCCPNRCYGASSQQWDQGPGLYRCTVIVPCPDGRLEGQVCRDAN